MATITRLKHPQGQDGTGFTPRMIGGCVLWLDSTVRSDGASQFTAATTESLSSDSNADLNVTTSDFSLAVWVNTSAAALSGLIVKRDRSGNNAGYSLEMNANGTVVFSVCDGSGAAVTATSTSTVNNGAWHLVVALADRDGNASVSVDGAAAEGAAAISGQALTLTNARTFYLGAGDNAGAERYLTGALALAGLWKKLLTAGEITSLYAAGAGLSYVELSGSLLTSLVAYWQLDEPSGTRVDIHDDNDLTDNNTVTAANGPNTHAAVDGAATSQWTDLSGSGNNVTQGTAASKPTYETGILNSRPVVREDGTNDWLANSSPALPSGSSHFTIFLATIPQRVNHSDAQNIFNFGQEADHKLVYLINPTSTTNLRMEWWGGNGTSTATGVLAAGTPLVATGIYNGATARLFVNGDIKVTTNYTGSNLGTSTLSIGRYSGGQYAQFDYCEAIVYNRALPTGAQRRIERYLGRKWLVGVQ